MDGQWGGVAEHTGLIDLGPAGPGCLWSGPGVGVSVVSVGCVVWCPGQSPSGGHQTQGSTVPASSLLRGWMYFGLQ